MEIFKNLIGNDDIKNTLGSAIKNGVFSHAYIIEGDRGTGKHTIARLASSAIMCQGGGDLPCGRCDFCRKILNDNCADVRFFDAFKVDDVRKIKETLYESSTECPYKIYIFNDAHKMNIKAQNALLISLEEPPKNVVFFLLCQDASYLLETIRSRAQLLRTKPLSNDVIFKYIRDNMLSSLSDESLNEIIVSSRGSLGYVLDMLDEKRAEELLSSREKISSFAEALLSNDISSYSMITSLFSMSRDALKELLSSALIAVRDMAVIKKDKNAALCFYASRENVIKLASRHSLKKILGIYDAIEKGLYDFGSNSNVPNTLTSILINAKKKGN
jgi:DNA polymerase-3 subunit delta'